MGVRISRLLALALTPALAGLSACADDPCRGEDGPRLRVYPEGSEPQGYAPNVYTSLREAAAAAEPGTTVCVAPGRWRESVVIDAEGVTLIGAGPERTTLLAPGGSRDPADSDWVPLQIRASGVRVEGLSIQGGAIGLKLDPGAGADLSDVELTENGIGLYSNEATALSLDGVRVVRNTELGAQLVSLDGPVIAITGGEFTGNGDLSRSPVGGLDASHPLELDGVLFSDNGGFSVGDLRAVGDVYASDLLIERPSVQSTGPRMLVEGGLDLSRATVHLRGSSGLEVRCGDGDQLDVENLALDDVATLDGEDHLRLRGCSGGIRHATLIDINGGGGAPLSVSGAGALEIANTALVGYDSGLASVATADEAGSAPQITTSSNFEGSLSEAALLRALDVAPDLRPQSDSPLIDAGEELGVTEDRDGRARPQGGAPDIGAYEY